MALGVPLSLKLFDTKSSLYRDDCCLKDAEQQQTQVQGSSLQAFRVQDVTVRVEHFELEHFGSRS